MSEEAITEKRLRSLAKSGWIGTAGETSEMAAEVIDLRARLARAEGGVPPQFHLVAHYDMGRRGDLSSLTIAMPHLNFADQLAVCRTILERLPVSEFRVDATGVGAALADELTESYGPERITEVRP